MKKRICILFLLFPFCLSAQTSTITLWKDGAMSALWNEAWVV